MCTIVCSLTGLVTCSQTHVEPLSTDMHVNNIKGDSSAWKCKEINISTLLIAT